MILRIPGRGVQEVDAQPGETFSQVFGRSGASLPESWNARVVGTAGSRTVTPNDTIQSGDEVATLVPGHKNGRGRH
ncbi:MAG: hypothetical protein D6775_08125 [Caldilineae bacterium]|nr:MAG: hypothetical protein D6775_08125 [Caldilineae bacterium]